MFYIIKKNLISSTQSEAQIQKALNRKSVSVNAVNVLCVKYMLRFVITLAYNAVS